MANDCIYVTTTMKCKIILKLNESKQKKKSEKNSIFFSLPYLEHVERSVDQYKNFSLKSESGGNDIFHSSEKPFLVRQLITAPPPSPYSKCECRERKNNFYLSHRASDICDIFKYFN